MTELTEEEYRQLTETVSEEMASRQPIGVPGKTETGVETVVQEESREVADHA